MSDIAIAEPAKPIIVTAPQEVKIDLACGQSCLEGYDGADIVSLPGVKYVVDLFECKFPWSDGSVDTLHCSHFVEHIPMDEIIHNGKKKDRMYAFFDECYRVLKPNGMLKVIVPSAKSERAFQDGYHRRFLVQASFLYLSKVWRTMNKLDHYPIEGNWDISAVVPTVWAEETIRSPEAGAHRFNHYWNITLDIHATLKTIK